MSVSIGTDPTSTALPTVGSASTRDAKVVTGKTVVRSRRNDATTSPVGTFQESDSTLSVSPELEVEPPLPIPVPSRAAAVHATPIQIWEGVVLSVSAKQESMQVRLGAKVGVLPDHTADIDLEWVHEQDRDLVRPGAVFYLTLFKSRSRGSIQNSQEIRFRRRPSWTKAQIQRIAKSAADLLDRVVIVNAHDKG